MKLEYRLEGDKLIISISYEAGLDKDADGMKSLAAKGAVEVIADGSELVDELLKNSSLLEKIKAKLGV